MRCMVCDAEMILMKVVPDDGMPVPGFERRTFVCSACRDVEQRLAFVQPGCESDAEPVPVHVAASNAGRQSEGEQPASLADAAPPIAGGQADDEQAMPLVDTPSSIDGELEHDPEKACPGLDPGWVPVFGKDHAPPKSYDDEEPVPLLDGAPSTAPAAAVPEQHPPARGLVGRVLAKVRGR